MIFSVYSDAVLFPLAGDSREKYIVGSPVVSATVVGQGRGKEEEEETVKEVEIVDLKDPVIVVLQLHSVVSLVWSRVTYLLWI